MLIDIEATDLPGRRFAEHTNVHVGVQQRREPVELVPGDRATARWRIELSTKVGSDGTIDFGGPFVQGRRGDRFIYLTWGDVGDDGSFEMFRRAKLMLDALDTSGWSTDPPDRLVAQLGLTDGRGGPLCAAVRPPVITWSAVDVSR